QDVPGRRPSGVEVAARGHRTDCRSEAVARRVARADEARSEAPGHAQGLAESAEAGQASGGEAPRGEASGREASGREAPRVIEEELEQGGVEVPGREAGRTHGAQPGRASRVMPPRP